MTADPGKLVAATLGVGLCLVALAAWALPTSGSPPGLDLRLIMAPPGELIVEPAGVLTSIRAMQAGDDPARQGVEVTNISGRRLRVRLVALPSAKELTRAVHLRATGNRVTLAEGTLAGLKGPHGAGLEIPARGSRRIDLSAWLPPAQSGYRGRILDLTLELRSQPLGAGR